LRGIGSKIEGKESLMEQNNSAKECSHHPVTNVELVESFEAVRSLMGCDDIQGALIPVLLLGPKETTTDGLKQYNEISDILSAHCVDCPQCSALFDLVYCLIAALNQRYSEKP
jgi:hypothetical protein